MLEFESITIRNFLSYGDYDTKLDLSGIGQCFIRGIVEDGSEDTKQRSNGAGKSNCINAILWCLSGRTKQSSRPGNKVLHWFSNGDCKVILKFKNGATLTRIRRRKGNDQSDIIYEAPGLNPIDTTLSTVGNEQKRLERELGFNWDIFCGSMFYGQYGQPWLEMGDQARKQTIERVLHIDKFGSYSEVARNKMLQLETAQEGYRTKLQSVKQDIATNQKHLEDLITSQENWAKQIQERRDSYLEQAEIYRAKCDAIQHIDITALKAKWDLVTKVKQHLVELNNKNNQLYLEISRINDKIKDKTRKIDNWNNKGGKVCLECDQDIPHQHVAGKIAPYEVELVNLRGIMEKLNSEKEELSNNIKKINAKIVAHQPDTSVREAEANNNEKQRYKDAADNALASAASVEDSENPNIDAVANCRDKIAKLQAGIIGTEKEISSIDILIKHYNYIHKAYSDRRKIKSYVIGKRIPYFNNRLSHYLGEFELDVKVSLTDSLSIDSNLWGYDYQSGGERMRTNVAFTLAMFDLHEAIFGRQCNVMVLDEVDGMLDEYGVDCLVSIIKNDLGDKVESLFIISHKESMADCFPREVTIVREGTIDAKNRCSRLREVR